MSLSFSMTASPHSLARLLEHVGWVRALARGLVADPDRAEDLVQETWRLALTRSPASLRSPRAWIVQVLRNVWLRDLRRDSARRTAEGVAARREAVAGELDVVERASTHRMLVELVTDLEEPFRTALLMRYFDELPPREIATRLGVPVATVHSRIQRGLERVRGRLDARNGGDREAWLGAMFGFLGPDSPTAVVLAPAAEASTTTLPGSIVMQTKIKLVLGGLLVVGGGVWILPRVLEEPTPEAIGADVADPAPPEEPAGLPSDPRLALAANGRAPTREPLPDRIPNALPGSSAPVPDARVEALDRVAASFLTEQPDIRGLANLVRDLAADVEVDEASIERSEHGSATGELTACSGVLTGSFALDDSRWSIEFKTQPAKEIEHWCGWRSLHVVRVELSDGSLWTVAAIEHHPRMDDTTRRLLTGGVEELRGWTVEFSPNGATSFPSSVRLGPEEKTWLIGKHQTLAPIEEPGFWDVSAWDTWFRELEPYREQ